MSKEIFNKKWGVNSAKAAEAVIMLETLEFVKDSTATNLEGELIFINDNKFLHNGINEKWEKSGCYVNDDRGIATNVKDLIRTVSFKLKLKLITKFKNKQREFNSDKITHLMKSFDNEAR